MNYLSTSILLALIGLAYSIPIDNGVVTPIEVECSATAVNVNFNTENNWGGVLFAKNHFDTEDCKVEGTGASRLAVISLDFDKCGVKRERSLNPRGVYIRAQVVMSFHPHFLTKVDRSVTVQCFYMEADKTVETDIEVSDLPTEFATINTPMPQCRYEVLDAPDGGNPIKFALIGQPVFHKWTCESDEQDIFCAIVHSCTVDDGNGDNIELLDENGCAIDFNLLDNLDYPSDLMAVKESHVFKYADRSSLYFQCQVNILVKEPGQECVRPQCGTPPNGSRAGRRKRQTPWYAEQTIGTIDVSPDNAVFVGDVELTEQDLPISLARRLNSGVSTATREATTFSSPDSSMCLSTSTVSIAATIAILLVLTSAFVGAVVCVKKM